MNLSRSSRSFRKQLDEEISGDPGRCEHAPSAGAPTRPHPYAEEILMVMQDVEVKAAARRDLHVKRQPSAAPKPATTSPPPAPTAPAGTGEIDRPFVGHLPGDPAVQLRLRPLLGDQPPPRLVVRQHERVVDRHPILGSQVLTKTHLRSATNSGKGTRRLDQVGQRSVPFRRRQRPGSGSPRTAGVAPADLGVDGRSCSGVSTGRGQAPVIVVGSEPVEF
jgi:hypothetical protein